MGLRLIDYFHFILEPAVRVEEGAQAILLVRPIGPYLLLQSCRRARDRPLAATFVRSGANSFAVPSQQTTRFFGTVPIPLAKVQPFQRGWSNKQP